MRKSSSILYVFAGILAVALIAVPANAQPRHFLKAVRALDRKTPIPSHDILRSELEAELQKLGRADKCTPVLRSIGSTRSVLGSPDLFKQATAGTLTNAWEIIAEADNCPTRQKYRFFRFAYADGRTRVTVTNTGLSYTNHEMIFARRNEAFGLLSTMIREAECPQPEGILNMQVVHRSPDLADDKFGVREKGQWIERWSIGSCGREFAIRLNFVANDLGSANVSVAPIVDGQ